VLATKLYAFSLGSAIAAVAGVLLGFRLTNVISSQFSVFASITVVGMTVVGGVGYIGGAIFAATLMPGGFGSEILRDFHGLEKYLPLVSGLFLLYVLRADQNGLFMMNRHLAYSVIDKFRCRPHGGIEETTAQPLTGETDAVAIRVDPRRLELSGLTVDFGGVRAVDHVTLTVEPGEVHGLIGPNGAGKTTVIDAVSGFVRPSGGEIVLDGRSLVALSPRQRARAGLTRSFQSLELFSDLTIRENLAVACDSGLGRRFAGDLVHPGAIELNEAASAVVLELGLTDVLDSKPDEISFGRRRIVAIARAVAACPSILMLDEPAAGLDDSEARELAIVIRRLAKSWGMGVLLVEHNTELVLDVCDRVTVLASGATVMSGPPDEVRHDRRVIEVYLGAPSDQPAETSP
jgi:sulfate-transporting ATPase